MKEETMLRILDRFIWYVNRNRLLEAKRYVQQELDNINGFTETKCKKVKLNKNFCKSCINYNCSSNKNNKDKNS